MKSRNKKNKLAKLLLPLIVMIAIILVLSLSFMNKKEELVIAKVNGEKIYKSEIDKKLKEIFNNDVTSQFGIEKLPPEMITSLVKDIYAGRKLDEKIKKSHLVKRADIKAKIDDYTKKITRNEYLEDAVRKKITDQAVKDKYVELINNLSGKKEIHLRHILVPTKMEAENILKQIKHKESFNKLAEKYSKDDTTAKDGGDLGYIFEDNLIPEFADFITNMKKGDVSDPIQTKYGWHIIKIEDFKDAEAPPFESVKSAVEEQVKKDEIYKILSGFTENAKVKILINLESSNNFDPAKSPKLIVPELIQDKE